jgi:nickel-type superoxide dismutase maturation protease
MVRRPGAIFGGVITVAAAIALARTALLVVRVAGDSMIPSLRSGDAVLTVRRRLTGPIRPGDVVVCRLPPEVPGPDGYLIKRVTSVVPGQITLQGDSEHSYDSRAFGPIPQDYVLGRVIARLTPARGAARARRGVDARRPPERTA